ncbi:hypothetical protein BH10ACT1_BH10ACT1_00540 [soil metagenome]
MSAERYVVLGLAHVRSAWFTEVARWSTAGSLPVEFVKCLSLEELRARVGSGRPFSGALLDARLLSVDRDLLATLADAGIPSLVVTTPQEARDWESLGAIASLADPLAREDLLGALGDHCQLIDGMDGELASIDPGTAVGSATWRGRLVAVAGHPGAGTSTLAAALAQSLADDPRYAGDVVLADLARRAHQALLHDARDVVPGIQELVEAHRTGRPSHDQLRHLAFEVPDRGYRLVLGLRRPRDWVSIRSRAFGAALEGLRRSSRIVVADIDADLEGEAATGSHDIEDRNLMARTVASEADLVVVVATPTAPGIHGLVNQLEDLRAHGISGDRLLVVVNRAPRQARARAELTRVIATLTGATERPDPHLGPAFVAERRGVDQLHRDLARFPKGLADPGGGAVRELLDRLPAHARLDRADVPVAIVPGSLGRWSEDMEEEAGP